MTVTKVKLNYYFVMKCLLASCVLKKKKKTEKGEWSLGPFVMEVNLFFNLPSYSYNQASVLPFFLVLLKGIIL